MNHDEQQVLRRIEKLNHLADKVLKRAADNLPESDKRREWIQKRVPTLKDDLDVLLMLKEVTENESSEWDEPLDKIESELQNLNDSFSVSLPVSPKSKEEPQEPQEPPSMLPSEWRFLEAEVIYHTNDGRKVKFSRKQISLGQRFDRYNKHIKAIETGNVRPVDEQGLVPSDKSGFNKKTKVLGRGGDYRFQALYEGDVLYFPGARTAH